MVGGGGVWLLVPFRGAGFGSDAAPGELRVSGLKAGGCALGPSSFLRGRESQHRVRLTEEACLGYFEPVGFQGFLTSQKDFSWTTKLDYLETRKKSSTETGS